MADKYELPTYTLSRVRYYDGEYLKDDEFIDEQKYHIDRRQRHDRLLHVAGVCEGLGLALANATTVKVSAGTAIDAQGRTILVGADQTLAIKPENNGALYVQLSFGEVADRPADANSAVSSNTRFTQAPTLVLAAAVQANAVVLGQAVIANGQASQVTATGRTYSGLRLPGPANAGYALHARGDASPGLVDLECNLNVTGTVQVSGNRVKSKTGLGILQTDATDCLRVNPDGDYPFTAIYKPVAIGTGGLAVGDWTQLPSGQLKTTSDAVIGGALQVSGNRIKNKTGLGMLQADAADCLRVNPDGDYPFTAIYKPVAIGTGGLAVGDWTQLPAGQLKVTSDATIGGKATVQGDVYAANSALYFTSTTHDHSGIGNTTGYAAIENSKNYEALMILGRAGTTKGRLVKLWDYLLVNGGLEVAGDAQVTGSRIKNKSGLGMLQANADDCLRVNPDSHYPFTAIYKSVAIGTGGLAIGDWSQQPEGNLKVTGSSYIGGVLSFGATVRQMINLWSNDYGIGVQSSTTYFRTGGNFAFYKGGTHNDAEWNAGGGERMMAIYNGNVKIPGNIGTSGYDPVGGLPGGWGGGVHTWDVAVRGTGKSVHGWQTGGWDLAEKFDRHDPSLEPGDVVVADPEVPERLIRSSAPEQTTILGVISEKPGFLLGVSWEDPKNPTALALAGRVPVKVTLEGGPIRIGDLLTSASEPGHAMRASRPARVIGMALSAFDGSQSDRGKVIVLINLHQWSPVER
ncbi:hypothetical protein WME90_32450 [Sorangium sp. So ce375]|uniref:hypothetical protein n=1 Tax=Sorangium sp. So ce375 TaxID=3133306 RepID=UPI003F5BE774